MSGPSPESLATAPLLTRPAQVWGFFLPLAATSLMMAVSMPVINAALARAPEATLTIAAFSLCFQTALLMNSMAIGLETAATHLIRGRRSFVRFLLLATVMGGTLSTIELVLALTPAGLSVFARIFGVSEDLALRARAGLLLFSATPLLLALRATFRGVHIRRGTTTEVGMATFARMLALSVVAWGGVRLFPDHGVAAGSAAFLVGIGTEALWMIVRAVPHVRALSDDNATARSLGAMAAFVGPLAASQVAMMAIQPAINAVLARTPDPATTLAAFAVCRSVVWLVSSVLFALPGLFVARSRTPAEATLVRSFAVRITLLGAGLTLVAALPPISEALLGGVIGVQGEVLRMAAVGMWAFPLGVVAMGARMFLRGRAVRDDHPWRALAAALLGLVGGFVVGGVLLPWDTALPWLGALMWAASGLIEVVYLRAMEQRDRRKRSEVPLVVVPSPDP